MHEIAIAKAIVEGACAEAHRLGSTGVRRVRCRVGVLRQIDSDLLRDAFELARGESACGRASLEVEAAPMTARCPSCGTGFEIASWDWSCPRCGAEGLDLRGGDELEIVSITPEFVDSCADLGRRIQSPDKVTGSPSVSRENNQGVGVARGE